LIQEPHTADLNPLYMFVQEQIDTLPMTCQQIQPNHYSTSHGTGNSIKMG